jgi:fatty-acyl-CoA synthase
MTPTRTVSDALETAAVTTRRILAIEHDGRSVLLTYSDLLGDALKVAGALHARGLAPGDRVAIVLAEVSDFIRAFFGISAAGLVPVPLCPPAQAGDLPTFARQSRHILVAARTSAVVTSEDVAPLLDLRGWIEAPIVLTMDHLRDGPALPAAVPVPLESTALIQFTSGSTALPKGVVLSHASLDANVNAITGPAGLAITPQDIGVSWLPLYHDMGLIGMLLTAVYMAADVVILSPVLFLKRPSAWLEAISKYGGTVSFAPTFAYDLCRRRVKPSQIDALNLASWRIAGCGAEPIRADSLLAFAEHFACAGFRQSSFVPSYGLAEHALAVALSLDGLQVDVVDAERLVRESVAMPATNGSASVRIVGCGRAFPGHALIVVDEQMSELPERHVGSILVRGPSVMDGYFEHPGATREALHSGWLHTGDTGYIANGGLYVCGRTKDLIIRQGRKYHPADLESAIADVPGIPLAGVVVFGINHIEEADEVVAVVEARASAKSGDVIAHVRRRIRETAGLELDRVMLAPPGTIPRTTSGKVRRTETRVRFQAGTLLPSGRGI